MCGQRARSRRLRTPANGSLLLACALATLELARSGLGLTATKFFAAKFTAHEGHPVRVPAAVDIKPRAQILADERGEDDVTLRQIAAMLDGSWRQHSNAACARGPRHQEVFGFGGNFQDATNCKLACRRTPWCRCVSLSGRQCAGPDWGRKLALCSYERCMLEEVAKTQRTSDGDDAFVFHA